jgi:hypothetical protein
MYAHTYIHTQAYSETIAPMVTEKADLLSESEMIT